ncbi:MAG: RHS repeat protein, partial [Moraxellaceae bacterium]
MKIVKGFLVIVACMVLLPHFALANRGIESNGADPHFQGGSNQEEFEDMQVKVLGGEVRITRIWKGTEWQWNDRWDNLTPQYQARPKNTVSAGDSQPIQVYDPNKPNQIPMMTETVMVGVLRAGQLYRLINETPEKSTFQHLNTKWIDKTATGYTWRDNLNNSIQYDLSGRIVSYADKNNVTVYIVRDADGYIAEIQDHFHQNVITYTWETYTTAAGDARKRLKKLTDYSGRTVEYSWNTDDQLVSITDVRDSVWTLGYEGKQLKTIKDPDNRVTRYEITTTGTLISRYDADGKGKKYSFKYDKNKEQSIVEEIKSDGSVETTNYNDIGGIEQIMLDGVITVTVRYKLNDGSDGTKEIRMDYDQHLKDWYRGSKYLYTEYLDIFPPPPKPREPDKWVEKQYVLFVNGEKNFIQYDQWHNPIASDIRALRTNENIQKQTQYFAGTKFPWRSVNAKGVVTLFAYDEHFNLKTLTEAATTSAERVTRYTYDAYGQIQTVTTGESAANNTALAVTHYEYDNRGNITKVVDPEGHVITMSDYDALGNARTIIDGRANTLPINAQYAWTTTFDNAGNTLAITDPTGKGTVRAYNATGDLISITSESGSLARITVNAAGLPLTLTDEINAVTKIEYDQFNRPVANIDANGNKTRSEFNNRGQLTKSTDGEGNSIGYEYGEFDLARIDYPRYKVFLNYGDQGDLIQSIVQANNRNYVTKFETDAEGNVTKQVDPADTDTQYEYDEFDHISKIIDAANGVTEYVYDARDNLREVKDPEGRRTFYSYDLNDELKTETYGVGGLASTITTDENGNLTSVINPEQEKTVYEYDSANRLTKTLVYANKTHSKPVKVITAQFNEHKQNAGWSQAVGTDLPAGVTATPDILNLAESYTYTNLEQIESVVSQFGGFSKTFSYTYYPNGLIKTYTNPEGITYTYYYNKNNQLIALQIPGVGQVGYTNFSWFMPQTQLLPGGNKIVSQYDDNMLLVDQQIVNASQQAIAATSYGYDVVNNVKTVTTGSNQTQFDYDSLNRLTSANYPSGVAANDESFTYDGVDNRVSHNVAGPTPQITSWAYNDKNQLDTIGAQHSFTYNNNGHTKTQTLNGVVTEYIYNHEERLIAVKQAGTTVAEYAYNPVGQRVKKTVNGVVTWYLYNANGLAAEYDNSGALIKEYAFHPQKTWMTDPLFIRTAANQYFYYQNDHLGTPQKIIDAAGQVVWQANYSAFGQATVSTSQVENNLRFPGQYFDSETGLHQNFKRDYDPALGRYIERDPIDLDGGLNTYGYAYQSPIVNTDPTGEIVPAIAVAFARCVVQCMAMGAAAQLLLPDPCSSAKAGQMGVDCAKLCANPLNWFKKFGRKGKQKRLRDLAN